MANKLLVNAISVPLTEMNLPLMYMIQLNSSTSQFCGPNSLCNVFKINMSVERISNYINLVKKEQQQSVTRNVVRDRFESKQKCKTIISMTGKYYFIILIFCFFI